MPAMVDIEMQMIANMLGIDKKLLKKVFRRNQIKELNITDNFHIIQDKLNETQEIIENVLKEVDEQKIIFEQKKEEADISMKISKLNQEELDAVNKLLKDSFTKEGKRSNVINIALGLIFCILGVVIGKII